MRLLLKISLILLSPALTLSYSRQSACFAGSNKRVGRARRTSRTRVFARGAPPSSSPGFSYVDGDNFETPEEEILAMGGDPFFLGDDSKDDSSEPTPGGTNLQVEPEDPTETKEWEGWDGIVDEEAHLDFY
jgi:hypothetical protein